MWFAAEMTIPRIDSLSIYKETFIRISTKLLSFFTTSQSWNLDRKNTIDKTFVCTGNCDQTHLTNPHPTIDLKREGREIRIVREKFHLCFMAEKKGLSLWMEGEKRSIEITERKRERERVEIPPKIFYDSGCSYYKSLHPPCAPTHRLHAPSAVRMRVSRVERDGSGGQRYAAVGQGEEKRKSPADKLHA